MILHTWQHGSRDLLSCMQNYYGFIQNNYGLIFRFFKCKINELGYCTRLTLLCGEKHGMCLPQAYDQPARLLGQCWPTFKKTLAVLALQRMTHGRLISMYEPLDEPENSWMAVCHATKQMNDNPKYVSSIPSSKWSPNMVANMVVNAPPPLIPCVSIVVSLPL